MEGWDQNQHPSTNSGSLTHINILDRIPDHDHGQGIKCKGSVSGDLSARLGTQAKGGLSPKNEICRPVLCNDEEARLRTR